MILIMWGGAVYTFCFAVFIFSVRASPTLIGTTSLREEEKRVVTTTASGASTNVTDCDVLVGFARQLGYVVDEEKATWCCESTEDLDALAICDSSSPPHVIEVNLEKRGLDGTSAGLMTLEFICENVCATIIFLFSPHRHDSFNHWEFSVSQDAKPRPQ